jgi:hypothetical protein
MKTIGSEFAQGRCLGQCSPKQVGLEARCQEVLWLREHYPANQQRACRLLQIGALSSRCPSWRNNGALRARLLKLAREKPRFGYGRLHILLDRTESR